MHCINIRGVDIMIWDCSLGIGLNAFDPLKGPLQTHLVVFQRKVDSAPVHKTKYIRTCIS